MDGREAVVIRPRRDERRATVPVHPPTGIEEKSANPSTDPVRYPQSKVRTAVLVSGSKNSRMSSAPSSRHG